MTQNDHKTSLYLTKKGNYFIEGWGGPASMWSVGCGQNSWAGGSGLRVISKEVAQHYAEQAELLPEEMLEAGFAVEEG